MENVEKEENKEEIQINKQKEEVIPEGNVTISLYVTNDFINRVGKARGSVARSTWIIERIEEKLTELGFGKSTKE